MSDFKVAIIGMGNMGAAVGRRLVNAGISVLSPLQRRSAPSIQRAIDAGIQGADLAEVAACDVVLSIVPSDFATAVATEFADALPTKTSRAPLYIDCNAASPATVEAVAKIVEARGTLFVDGSIVGLPAAPRFYVSGPHARLALKFLSSGLQMTQLEGPIWAASSLKMSYAGITKGLTAIGTAMMLAARKHGVEAPLLTELSASQPELLAWFQASVPRMPRKAHRWVAEMREIEKYVGENFVEHTIYASFAHLYARIASDPDLGKMESLFAICDRGH